MKTLSELTCFNAMKCHDNIDTLSHTQLECGNGNNLFNEYENAVLTFCHRFKHLSIIYQASCTFFRDFLQECAMRVTMQCCLFAPSLSLSLAPAVSLKSIFHFIFIKSMNRFEKIEKLHHLSSDEMPCICRTNNENSKHTFD